MSITKLGRLQPVDLRTVWTNEADDFTPWLAGDENLALLGDTIGLDLELEGTEQQVGPFRADIVCKDTITDTWVLIENQLERTDHTHLGQLITYAAGLNAVTIVWIADRFTEEHRAAPDWLNEVTGQDINFFGLEVELWRINQSPVAPKFNIVSKPNEWMKILAANRQPGGSLTETKELQLAYWTAFQTYIEAHSTLLKPRKPYPQQTTNFAIGHSDFQLQAFVHTRNHYIGVSIVITGPDAKPYYHLLHREKSEIEAEVGQELTWYELPGKKSSIISVYRYESPLDQPEQWSTQHEWLLEMLETVHQVFAPRIQTLNAVDYAPDVEDLVDG